MNQEVVTRIKLDTSSVPPAAAQAAQAIGSIGRTGEMSARQTAAAMRMLPAQFTDVATQLAGGQNPLLILLQQGGQVRDQFGSIGAALRGVGSFITPFSVAVGGAALAVGALGKAYRDASAEQDAIVRGLVLSGNAAGVTANQINDLARAQDEVVGTRAAAAQALTQLAASGVVVGTQLGAAAEAAVRLERVGGPAVEETARKFIDLGRDPMAALERITREENAFTAAIVRQVAELTEQGRVAEAAAVAQRAYADVLVDRAGAIEDSLGYLQRGWNFVRDAAAGAWDAMLNIGRPDTLQERLGGVQGEIEALQQRLSETPADTLRRTPEGIRREVDLIRERIAAKREEQAQLQEQIILERKAAEAQAEAARRAREAAAAARANRGGRRGIAGNAIEDAELDIQRRIQQWAERNEQVLDQLSASDQLGEFIIERVLPADQQRNEQRLAQQMDFLQQLTEANLRANTELITDDEQRALAVIELDRKLAQQRINAIYEAGPLRAAAEREADAIAQAQREQARQRFATDTALVTREQVRDALANALRDAGGNPAEAFAQALGNVIFQRVTNRLADALATAAVGSDGTGGFLGDILGSIGASIFGGGGRASGGSIGRGGVYEITEDRAGGEVFNTRSGRSYLLAAEDGDIVPARRRSGGAGGAASELRIQVSNLQGQTAEVTSARRGSDGVLDIQMQVKQIVIGDIAAGGDISQALSRQFGVSRAAGLPRRG